MILPLNDPVALEALASGNISPQYIYLTKEPDGYEYCVLGLNYALVTLELMQFNSDFKVYRRRVRLGGPFEFYEQHKIKEEESWLTK